MNLRMAADYGVTWSVGRRGRGTRDILSVARIAYARIRSLEPTSVTPTRQIGWDKLISFTGDLDDPRCRRGRHLTSSAHAAIHVAPAPGYKWILQHRLLGHRWGSKSNESKLNVNAITIPPLVLILGY